MFGFRGNIIKKIHEALPFFEKTCVRAGEFRVAKHVCGGDRESGVDRLGGVEDLPGDAAPEVRRVGAFVGGEFAHDLPLLQGVEVGVVRPEPPGDPKSEGGYRPQMHQKSVKNLLCRRGETLRVDLVFLPREFLMSRATIPVPTLLEPKSNRSSAGTPYFRRTKLH